MPDRLKMKCARLSAGHSKDDYRSDLPETIIGQKFQLSTKSDAFFRSICCLYKMFSTYCKIFL